MGEAVRMPLFFPGEQAVCGEIYRFFVNVDLVREGVSTLCWTFVEVSIFTLA